MATYIVGYDKKEGEDYEPLEDRLKQFGKPWHELDSTWLIVSDMTAKEVREDLGALTHRLLVIDVTGQMWSARGFSPAGNKWLHDNVTE
jgi:hypothetical protein